ncbi:hypothetical protein CKO15_07705 [Halorhodospira abdelmalekii]|uniref:AAA family ATPase n=1 Tax=Halorhodospira abdelmalekii TaxID=421629 RepID=UPI001907B95F|nr:AAA family ATPase [Halorhodospira abdelmalekii]MBK1735169.1 hypothetical protein [Halorhodospira abdelmalekii]
MRVLAIRGSNLAALAEPFEIDFQAAPLATAGLFAITGTTGSGKSTLLDALALALFHDTPRLRSASEQSVQIPDTADSALSPHDPRNILRRGAGSGFAEVDYIGIDGGQWRARWEVRRARNRPTGRLQQASASLEDRTHGRVVSGRIRETREKIEQTLGLSYEQFCRSVLLAQNEFAAFLRADVKARAELLESLTGTEIYRTLSQRCHQRTAEESRRLDRLESELALDPPLEAPARQALESELAAAQRHREQAQAAFDQLQREANWHERGRALEKRGSELADELTACRKALAERHDETLWIRRLEAIEPARPLDHERQRSERALNAHLAQQGQLTAEHEKAKEAHAAAQQQLTTQQERLTAAESTQQAQIPVIRQARAIDQEIARLTEQLQEQERQADALTEQRNTLSEQLQSAQRTLEANRAQRDAWPEWQEKHPQLAAASATVDEWRSLGRELEAAVNAGEQRAQAAAALAAHAQEAAAARTQIAQAKEAQRIAAAAVQEKRTARDEAATAEQRFDAAAIEQQRSALSANERQLERFERQLDTTAAAAATLTDKRSELSAERRQQASRVARLTQLQALRPAAEARLKEAEKAWQISANIVDRHTEVLRRQLHAGEPCPVCGSREHPGHAQSDDELRTWVDALQRQRQEAEADCQALLQEETATHTEIGQGALRLDRLHAEEKGLRQKVTLAYLQLLHQAGAAGARGTLELQGLKAQLAPLQTALGERQIALQEQQRALETARQRYREAQKELGAAEKRLEQHNEQLAKTEQQAAPLLEANERARIQLEDRQQSETQSLTAVQRRLRTTVPPTIATVTNLLAQWQEGEQLRQQAESAEQQRPLLERQLAEHQRQLSQLTEQEQHDRTAQNELAQQLEAQRRQRHEILSASDLNAYEEQLAAASAAARRAHDEAVQAESTARTALSTAENNLQHWQREREKLEREQQHAHQQLAEWLRTHHADAAIDLPADDLDTLLELLATPPEQWQPQRDALEQLRQEHSRLEMRQQENAEQLERWRAEGISQRGAEAVAAALTEANTALTAAAEQLADLRSRLNSDDERKKRTAGRLEALRQQQTVTRQWQQLDELIGSANGDKFQRYAQQWTLDVLLTYANAQLASLAPRYRLQRGSDNLNILVNDDDMGGEIRGVHSLSGGETFLASLALALGLAELSSQRVRLESLFIDEGFGSLDADTLRIAMDALDRLQSQGRKVGVISHIDELSERIGTRIEITRTAPGKSAVRVRGGGLDHSGAV